MPLRAQLDGEEIFAIDYTDDDWAALKRSYRKRRLVTLCCQARAIPKTSQRGLRFFAHVARDGCTSAPETEEHLYLKSLAVAGARAAGWDVDVEVPGVSPDGQAWVADVLAVKGTAKVAIEIQWSPQQWAEYQARQQRYWRSGVRALWLVREGTASISGECGDWDDELTPCAPDGLPETKELPAFGIDPRTPDMKVKRFGIGVQSFVQAALEKRLKWKDPPPRVAVDIGVTTIPRRCWKCEAEINIITELVLTYPDGTEEPYELHDEVLDEVEELLLRVLTRDDYRLLRTAPLARRWALNACSSCGAPVLIEGRGGEDWVEWADDGAPMELTWLPRRSLPADAAIFNLGRKCWVLTSRPHSARQLRINPEDIT